MVRPPVFDIIRWNGMDENVVRYGLWSFDLDNTQNRGKEVVLITLTVVTLVVTLVVSWLSADSILVIRLLID